MYMIMYAVSKYYNLEGIKQKWDEFELSRRKERKKNGTAWLAQGELGTLLYLTSIFYTSYKICNQFNHVNAI